MDLWDADSIGLPGPAFIEIGADGTGTFRFIAVEGDLDGRHLERHGRPAVECSWIGTDDEDETSGRGWAVLQPDGALVGHIYFHRGDDSGFRATAVQVPD